MHVLLDLRYRARPLLFAAVLAAGLGVAALVMPGCSLIQGARHVETMNDAQFASYLLRVRAWSHAAAYTLVSEHTIKAEEAHAFASAARAATGSTLDLAALAAAAGLEGPLLCVVLLEGQALIDAHEFAEERTGEILRAVAAGVDEGAALATDGPSQP